MHTLLMSKDGPRGGGDGGGGGGGAVPLLPSSMIFSVLDFCTGIVITGTQSY